MFLLDVVPSAVTLFQLSCDPEMEGTILALNSLRALGLLYLAWGVWLGWKSGGGARDYLREHTDAGSFDHRLESGVGTNPNSAQ